jgi:rhomboid protease GluP
MPKSASFGRRSAQTNATVPKQAKEQAFTLPRLPKLVAVPSNVLLARVPLFSLGLFAVFVAIFQVELNAAPYSAGGTPSLATIVALGGVSRVLVLSGEWWRLFTAPLLHASYEHLLSNGFVLILDGFFLESLIGRRWYAATFAIGAVAGTIASISLNDPHLVSVGASGGIMALLGATFVCSFGDGADEKRSARMRRLSLRLLIPSLLPLAAHVDTSAHLGGAAAGGCIGFLLQIVWREGTDRPGHARVAGAISAVGAMVAVISFALVSLNFGHYAAHGDQQRTADAMIPDEQLRGNALDLVGRSDEFVTHYPRDPRSHLYHALRFRIEGDLSDSEQELRQAIALRGQIDDEWGEIMQIELAVVLLKEGRAPEAKAAVGRHACAYAKELEDDGKLVSDAHDLEQVCN